MLKIAVFDTGFGGELFADRLEEEMSVVGVIRVIDWRHAKRIEQHPHEIRKITESALRPYIGTVDLIIIANYQISTNCLSHLRRKYPDQKFVGFTLRPNRILNRPTIILTTKPTTRSLAYFLVARELKAKTICLDRWPSLIDDGELTDRDFENDLERPLQNISHLGTYQVLLACGQLNDCLPKLRETFGHNARIVDSFDHTLLEAKRTLHLR